MRRGAAAVPPLLLAAAGGASAYPADVPCAADGDTKLRLNQTMMNTPVTAGNASLSLQGAAAGTFTPGELLTVELAGAPPGAWVALRVGDGGGELLASGDLTLRRTCPGQLYSTGPAVSAAGALQTVSLRAACSAATLRLTAVYAASQRQVEFLAVELPSSGGSDPSCAPRPPPTPAPALPPAPPPPPRARCAAAPRTVEYDFVVEDWVVDYLRPTTGARKSPWDMAAEVRKSAALVNGAYPGQLIEACENDTVRIVVQNRMLSDALTLHWHGIHPRAAPWADGATGVTQSPIPVGANMTYEFAAWPPGTHYWHAHMDAILQARGLRGPIVVHRREDPYADRYDYDQVVVLSDEWQNPAVCLMLDGATDGNPVCAEVSHLSFNGEFGNGTAAYPYPTMEVHPGKCYRMRFVMAASNAQDFIVSIAGHNVTLISVDSYDVKPLLLGSFKIAVGERIDAIVCADQEPGYYPVTLRYDLACPLTPGHFIPDRFAQVESCEFYALLRYNNTAAPAPTQPDAATCRRPYGGACAPDGTGGGAGSAPAPGHDWDLTLRDSLFGATEPLEGDDMWGDEPETPDRSYVIDLGMLAPAYTEPTQRPRSTGRWYSDATETRRPWHKPATPLLHTKGRCGAEGVPVIDVPEDAEYLEFQFNDLAATAHVMHLHGLPFKVVNYANYSWCTADKTSCFQIPYSASYPFNPCPPEDKRLSDPTSPFLGYGRQWGCVYNASKYRPMQQLKGALIKDSFQIFRRSWAVLRVRANVPGVWLFHCHMEQHIPLGMSFALNVLPSKQPKIPAGVPTEGPCPVWSANVSATARMRGEIQRLERLNAELQRRLAERGG